MILTDVFLQAFALISTGFLLGAFVSSMRFGSVVAALREEIAEGTRTVLDAINQAMEEEMSTLTDAIQAAADSMTTAEAATDAAVARVQSDVSASQAQIAGLQKQIADLEAQIAAGGAPTQADLDALASLKARLDAMTSKVNGIDPTNPATIPASTGG